MKKYLDMKKIYISKSKIDNAISNGELSKYDFENVFALHDALMVLRRLVKLGIIGFDKEGRLVGKD